MLKIKYIDVSDREILDIYAKTKLWAKGRGKMKVNIRTISEMTGFSQATVSNVLNNKKGANKKTAAKILQVAREIGYLDVSKIESVKIVVYKKSGRVLTETPLINSLIEGVESECRENGLTTIICNISMEDERYESDLQQLLNERESGIILLATELEWEEIKPFQELVVPLVVVDAWYREGDFDTVIMDNTDSVFKSVSYLIQRGYRTIGYLDSKVSIRNFIYRKQGYRMALEYYGMTEEESFNVELDPMMNGAYEDMKKYLDMNPKLPEAYCAVNDIIALGAMKALSEKGIRIPQDVAIIGFDNMPFGEFASPALTTIHVPKRELGVRAVKQLLDQCGNIQHTPVKTQFLTKIIERDSVGWRNK